MAKLIDFVKSLIVKGGGKLDDEKIKAALESFNVDAELPEDIAKAIDHGLISIEQAKNNHPDIKKHYYALAMNGVDSEIDRIMEDEKFSDELVNELKSEKSSTKRMVLLNSKIKDLERQKSGANKTDTKALNDKITELNGLLSKEKESINGIKADYEKKLREKDKNYALRNSLGSYKTIFDKFDPATKDITINAIIQKNLASKGLILDTDENGVLVLTTKDGSTAFGDDHRPLTPQSFFDKTFADENILAVNDSNGNNSNNGQQRQQNNNGQQRQQNNNGFNQNRNQQNNGGQQNNGNQNGGGNGGSKSGVLQELLKNSQDAINKSANNSMF